MTVKKITPVLLVDSIEPLLPFWIHGLAFEKTIEVPLRQRPRVRRLSERKH